MVSFETMNEIERIKKNINGETPSGKYDILRIEDIDNAQQVLENFKKSIITILENQYLSYENKKWNDLLPKEIVEVVEQFNSEDYKNDDLLTSINMMVDDVLDPDIKDWQWYSSKLFRDGFVVYFEGIFRGPFVNFVRFHKPGIPLNKITIERNGIVYPVKVYKDVMSYRRFD